MKNNIIKFFVLILLIICIVPFKVFSQDWETLGAGVIEFLLTNPSTANKTNETQRAALSVIGQVLSISAQRQHEVNVASAGRDEIIINTSTGNQATVYTDQQGKVYLLFEGTIYPISDNLVNQAKNEYDTPEQVSPRYENTVPPIENATLPNYNLEALKNEYKFEILTRYEKGDFQRIYLEKKAEHINEITLKYNITKDDIYFAPYYKDRKRKSEVVHELDKKYTIPDLINILDRITGNTSNRKRTRMINIYNSQKSLTKTSLGVSNFNKDNSGFPPHMYFYFPTLYKSQSPDGFYIYINPIKTVSYYNLEIVTIFTCSWARDFDGSGFDFDEFQGIKRSFHIDEKIVFVMGYTIEEAGTWKLEICEALTGKTVLTKERVANKGAQVITTEIEEKLPANVYIFNFSLFELVGESVSKTEKFEIIEKSSD